MQTLTLQPSSVHMTPNHWQGRNNLPVSAIVVHKGEGSQQSIINTFLDPSTTRSAHYVIAYNGNICNMVDPNNAAWHCGVVVNPDPAVDPRPNNPNWYTIGIEMEGYAGMATTVEQYASLTKLLAYLIQTYHLAATPSVILFHHDLDKDKPCPGAYVDRNRLIDGVNDVLLACMNNRYPTP